MVSAAAIILPGHRIKALKRVTWGLSISAYDMTESVPPSTRSSICLVVCFFGTLPPYLPCVLRSVAANVDIDWLIFSDAQPPAGLPRNMRWQAATLDGLQRRFSSRLGYAVNLSRHRLLCHFKAAYGFFFEEELGGYDFWGHCDLDMIFGDLRKYLREDILQSYPKILCRGHLCLYRNVPEVNRFFQLQAPGVTTAKEAFTSGRLSELTFDEWRGIYAILRFHGIPQFHDEFIVDVVPPTRWKITRLEGTAIRNYPQQVFYWHGGKVFHAHYNCDRGLMDDEYAYVHFQKRPMPAPGFDPAVVRGFLITPDGFFPYNRELLSDEDLARYNRERWRSRRELFQVVARGIGRRLGLVPARAADG